MLWLTRHFEEFGYSQGLLSGVVGTLAVLITALLLAYTLRRSSLAALAAGTAVGAAGIAWLATH
ncbi:hypothetical protein [Streptomyces sp. NPDC097981]|uniref:hypothetical protein n=1 Tax=Streptomyces sp. NPDC097981 TaxID=3155428 RepID=UPI00331AFE5F